MKKQILSLAIFLSILIPCNAFSKYINFGAALSSGFNIHSAEDEARTQPLNTDSAAAKILIGANADATFGITEPLQLITGADLFCDFNYKDKYYYNTFDYSFYAGIRIFPNLQGLNFSVSYALGCRTDYLKYVNEEEDFIRGYSFAKWGNGFRLSAEYIFLLDSETKFKPFMGFYYRYIPRGNNLFDNILTAYVGVRF